MEAKVHVVVSDFDLLEKLAIPVGLYERGSETPVDGVLLVCADALQVVTVRAFTFNRAKRR